MVVKLKKKKEQKKRAIKRKLKFRNYKNCLEKYLEKNKTDADSIKENHKELIRNNQSILKTQQRLKSERHNVFTEEINKTALSLNDDKRMQSTDSIETYAYGRIKDLVSEKEEIKCSNIIKRCKKEHKKHKKT